MGYNKRDGMHMESAKQERHNLLHDNPVARDASGGRPWISKHFQSSMSPLKEGHDSPAEKELSAKQEAAFGDGKNPGLEAAIEASPAPKLYDAAGHMHTPFHKDEGEVENVEPQARPMYHKIKKKVEPKKKEEA
tara:strand:+ start:309 stop:710 length:402 start_codon:yes stop_codon:yes gene_type:complete